MPGSPPKRELLAHPQAVPVPRVAYSLRELPDMDLERGVHSKPLRSGDSELRELFVPRAFAVPVAALEREDFVVRQAREPHARARSRADLDLILEAEVVHDVYSRRRSVPIGKIADLPLANRAQPPRGVAHPEARAAQPARRGQSVYDSSLARDPVVGGK